MEKVAVVIKSPFWSKEEEQKWIKFKEWIEKNGGEWEEGFTLHRVLFEPIKD